MTIMKLNKLLYCFALTALLAITVTSCSGCGNKGKEYANNLSKVICDESFKNILDEEIQVFEYQYKDKNISVLPLYLDESSALDSLLEGKVNVIITYRDLTLNQKKILILQRYHLIQILILIVMNLYMKNKY